MVLQFFSLGFVFLLVSCKQGFEFSNIPTIKNLRQLQTDSYVQTQAGDYDFLWVVDNSGSMADEQTVLQNNFEKFLKTLSSRQRIDYRMGVTTMDMSDKGEKGNLVSSDSKIEVITNLLNDPVSEFKKIIGAVGKNGSGLELGLEASLTQLQKPHAGLFRNNVPLVLIYLSDEDDDDQAGKSPNDIEDRILQQLLQMGVQVEVFAMVGLSEVSCSGVIRKGKRYIDFVERIKELKSPQLSGTALSICKSDLTASFDTIATKLADAGYVFPLSQINPIESTLEVFIGGQKLHKSGPDFSYDKERNSIVFNQGYEPNLNQEITIRYEHAK